MKKIVILLIGSFPVIVSAQNVGIGTTTPGEKLEIKNPLRSTLKISSNSLSDTTQVIFSNTGSTAGFYSDFSIKSVRQEGLFFSSTSDLAENTSSNSLVIRPGGNIGLGTNLPVYRLQVNEPVAASTYMSLTNPITGSKATDGLVLGLTGNSGILYNLENSSLQLGTDGNTRLMIEGDGDVGIGTISPTEKLDVNGNIKLTGELNRTSTGDANLVPIAWGIVDSDGSLLLSSNNVTSKKIAIGHYQIVITGEDIGFESYSTIVTPSTNFPRMATTTYGISGTNIFIWYPFSINTTEDCRFNFVMYKK